MKGKKIRAQVYQTIKRFNKDRYWIFEMINKVDIPLTRVIKGKKSKHIQKVDSPVDAARINKIREYQEQRLPINLRFQMKWALSQETII